MWPLSYNILLFSYEHSQVNFYIDHQNEVRFLKPWRMPKSNLALRPENTCLPFTVACIGGKGRVALASRPVKVFHQIILIFSHSSLFSQQSCRRHVLADCVKFLTFCRCTVFTSHTLSWFLKKSLIYLTPSHAFKILYCKNLPPPDPLSFIDERLLDLTKNTIYRFHDKVTAII